MNLNKKKCLSCIVAFSVLFFAILFSIPNLMQNKKTQPVYAHEEIVESEEIKTAEVSPNMLKTDWASSDNLGIRPSAVTYLKFKSPSSSATTNEIDISAYGTGIYPYVDGTTLYIVSDNPIYAPEDCSNFFIKFNKSTEIHLDNFYTINTTNMCKMFYSCDFIQLVTSENFNTSNVTTMQGMFQGCNNLLGISGTEYWNTSNVEDMSHMFRGCNSLQSPKFSFNLSSCLTVNSMFYLSTVYDLTLTFTGNEHSTHNIDATDMFRQSSFRSVSIKGANLYNTLNMSNMFYSVSVLDTASITVTLTNLKTSNMRGMFYWSEIKTITFSAFDTSSCTNMSNTFKYCEALRTISGISTWDTQNVTDMSSMFYECINLKTMDDIGGWNTGNVMNMSHMFYKYRYETSSNISMDLSNWDVGKVTNMSHMFYLCGYLYLTSLGDLSNWDVSNVTDMNSMFYVDSYDLTSLGDLNKWDVSNVTDMNSMFRMCSGLLNLGDLKNWNVDNVTDMSYMFYNCANLTSVGNIESWKPKLNNLNSMFYDCNNLIELNLSNFDTSNVTDMSYMLHNCKNLTTIGDIGGWDTSKVLTMAYMFSNCTQLLDINVSNFDTSMCNNMTHMFDYCNTVSILDVSKFNTSLVTDMSHMFNGCSSISKLNLKSFDTSSVTSISYMFNGCKIKVLDLSNFNLSKCTTTRLYFGVGLQTLVMPYRGYTSTNANVQILFNTSYSSESPYYVTTKQTQANSNPFSILLSNNSVHKLALKRGSSSSTLPTNWFETFTSKNAEISDKSKVNSIKLEFYAPEDYILLTSVSGVAYYYKTNNNGLFDLLMASTSPIYAPSDAANLFSNFVNVTKIDLTNFWTATDTASLKRMFYNCPKLTNIDLSTFHTNNVTDFSEMFMGCSSLKTLNLAFLNMTSATSTTNMLAGCNSLKEIDAPHSTSSTVTIDLNTETQFYLKHTTTPVITQLTNDTTKYGFSVFSNKVDSNANLGQGDFYGDYVIEVETLVTLNSITYCDKDSMYFSGVFETDYPKTFYFGTEIDLTNVIPVKAHHSFGGWFLNYDCSGEPITLITEEMQEGNLTLYALWTPVKYTVNWFNFDGSLLYSAEETYGTLPTFKGDAPFRPNDSKFQYTFEGWSPNITAVEGITEYWATYSAVQKRFTITWINYNGVVLKNEEVDFEVVPNYDGITPTRDEDAQYIYTFSGWDKEIVPAIEDKIYVATFSTTTKTYKITWIDENDDILEIDEEVEYGTMPTYDGDTPTKETDAQYIYTFKGWYPLVEKVTGNATYKVTYTNTIRTYKITWKHSNGETLETDEAVPYGNNPSYDSTFPTINETEQYFYIFTGWTPTLSPVTGDKTYTAVFEEVIKTYTITWINEDNSLLEIDYYVPYGSNPIFNAAGPTMATDAQYIYEFKEWSPKITTVTSDATYKATYSKTIRTYTIIWSSYNGVLETDENIPYGTTPSFDKPEPYRPADAQYTYTFAGWNPEIDIVKGNITYTAIFTTTINTYTITWKDDDGTILQLDENIEYGVIPSYNGDDPSKSANVQYTYYFTGWTPKIDIVKADATYTATYLQKINTYTVTWLNYNDIVLKTEHNVEYGTIPNYGEPNPTRPTDAQYSYEFIGWNPQILEDTIITGNTVFVANYSTTLQTYTVVWTTYNGNVLETDTNVPYGATPSYEGNTPEKPKDNQFTYTFAGWSPTLSMVEGDIIYSAVFNETINTYTITYIIIIPRIAIIP